MRASRLGQRKRLHVGPDAGAALVDHTGDPTLRYTHPVSFRQVGVKAVRPFLIWYATAFATLFILVGVLVVVQGAPPTVIPRVFKQAFLELAPKWPF